MSKSKIQWTDRVWNPISGCSKISEGCKNCYAQEMHNRLHAMGSIKYKELFDKVVCHEDKLTMPDKWTKPHKVFVNSMSDLFHEDVPYKFLDKVFNVIDKMEMLNKGCVFQILTKRPERMYDFYARYGVGAEPQNVWLGVTAENQKEADHRIPFLLRTPAKVRFVSIEPCLEKVDIFSYISDYDEPTIGSPDGYNAHKNKIDWVIVGCESGPKRRECKIEWIESIVEQCKAANVPVFVKQISINGKVVKDVEKFPKHLQMQQFPGEAR